VIVDGNAVLVRSRDGAGPERVLGRLDGVAGVVPFAPGILYAHAVPGRAFATGKLVPRGVHGCPQTAPTLCVATGGHPGVAALRRAFAGNPPTNATLGRLLASVIDLHW
jgi:hypothetical protein